MRRRLIILALTTMTLLCLAALSSRDVFAQQKPRTILVYEVKSVDVSWEKSLPGNALVKAKGKVTTGGHTNPRLALVLYAAPPADGIQDLLFQIDAPAAGSIVTQAEVEVETPLLRVEQTPSWFKGFRVHAETNKIEKLGR